MTTRFEPPPAVRWIVGRLEDAGFETWCVGGAVRDVVAGRTAGDWDLATRARPADVRRVFRRVVPLGVEHGTVGVLARDGTMYEVTTFRRDVETDGRHAVVAFADRIEEDLARRDFTINALAWHPLRDELLDPYDGAGDLRRRVLRTVGRAADRFAEDYLRVLRAVRFAGLFRLDIEADTWEAMRAAVPGLRRLSAERVRDELLKILGADAAPSAALELLRASGALGTLFPELDALSADAWRGAVEAVDHLPRGRALLRLAGLLRPLEAEAAAALLLRLRLSNAEVDRVARMASAPPPPPPSSTDADLRRWLRRVGREHARPVLRLALAAARAGGGGRGPHDVVGTWRRVRRLLASDPPLTVADLDFGGGDLRELGLRPGPLYGTILDSLLDWVVEDPERNRRSFLRERAREIAAGRTRDD